MDRALLLVHLSGALTCGLYFGLPWFWVFVWMGLAMWFVSPGIRKYRIRERRRHGLDT